MEQNKIPLIQTNIHKFYFTFIYLDLNFDLKDREESNYQEEYDY